jgi:hypothetical protein
MANLLFVVHGMGVHGADWADSVLATLRRLPDDCGYKWLKENGGIEGSNDDRRLDIVPLSYDRVFDRLAQQWSKDSKALRESAYENGISIPNVLGWLERASEVEHNFFWTHVVDVLMYRFFSIVTADARTRMRAALAEVIEPAMRDGEVPEISVLAHSLGTSVMHDTLALLGSQPIDGNQAFMAGNLLLSNVFMIANVSRVLETSPAVFRSVVHPQTATSGAADAYVQRYYNFRHRFDPFPAVRPFGPVGWGAGYTTVEDCERVLKFNVHDLEHYLNDPRVHIPIFRALAGSKAVTKAEQTRAIAAYDATPEPRCLGELHRFETTIERLIAVASAGADPESAIIAATQFLAAAQEAKDACH